VFFRKFPQLPNEAKFAGGKVKSDIDAIYAKGIRLSPEAYDFLEAAAVSGKVLEKIITGSEIVVGGYENSGVGPG